MENINNNCKPLNEVGILHVGSNFRIYEDGNGEYFTISDDTGDRQDFTWEERLMYLCKPWDKIRYYEGEDGRHHYICIVYDYISIDIWANTIDNLMNLICNMLKPTDEIEELVTDRIAEHNRTLAEKESEQVDE